MKRKTALLKLTNFAALAPGWDSYGAKPISLRAILKAKRLLGQLTGTWYPVPLSDGGVQLESHENGIDVEIQVWADEGDVID